MKSLILITHHYPLNRGDAAFIKSEIPFLTKQFDKIYVLSLGKRDKNNNLLDVPKNVEVNFANANCGKVKKRILQILLLFMPIFLKESLLIIRNKKLSFHLIKKAIIFLYEAIILKDSVKQILKRDEHIGMIYTYWYVHETLCSLLLKETFNSIVCITRAHGCDVHEFRNSLNYQPYKLWMDKRIDKVYFASKHLHDYYLNKFARCNMNKYAVAQLGIINKYLIEIKEMNNCSIFTLCSCSNIVLGKRIHLIINALSELTELKIHWIHIGDGNERDFVETLANEKLHNKKNISYKFKGYMENDQIMRFYSENHIDCFISTTEAEGGCPVSMQEAISFGIPVIATNAGGVSEIVNNDTGILLGPDGDISEISNAIVNFINMPQNKKIALRKTARAFWETNFNAEINHAKFAHELISLATNNLFIKYYK